MVERADERGLQIQGETVVEEDEARSASSRLNEEVAWVRVGVHNAVRKELFRIHVVEQPGNLAAVYASPLQGLYVCDLHALHVLHDEQAPARQLPDHPGYDHVVPVREYPPQVRDRFGLPNEVQLKGQGPSKVVRDRLQPDPRLQARDRLEDSLQRVEVGLDEVGDARVLDLDGNLPAIVYPRAMHLRDGGGGDGLPVERGENFLRWTAQLPGHGLPDGRVRLRRDPVLERGERCGVGG